MKRKLLKCIGNSIVFFAYLSFEMTHLPFVFAKEPKNSLSILNIFFCKTSNYSAKRKKEGIHYHSHNLRVGTVQCNTAFTGKRGQLEFEV